MTGFGLTTTIVLFPFYCIYNQFTIKIVTSVKNIIQ